MVIRYLGANLPGLGRGLDLLLLLFLHQGKKKKNSAIERMRVHPYIRHSL